MSPQLHKTAAVIASIVGFALAVPLQAYAIAPGDTVCEPFGTFDFGEQQRPMPIFGLCKAQNGEEVASITLENFDGDIHVGFSAPSNFSMCDNPGHAECVVEVGDISETVPAGGKTGFTVDNNAFLWVIDCYCTP